MKDVFKMGLCGDGRVPVFFRSLTAAVKHICYCDEIEPLAGFGSKLFQFSRKAAQRKKYVAGLVPPALFSAD